MRPVVHSGNDPALLPRLVELARLAEERGFDLFAVPERLGDGGVPAALPVCAAIAAATTRIAIATAVLPLALHHPLRVAEDAATVDGLSDGRFELGIGLGAERGVQAGFGLEVGAGARGKRFEEAVTILRAAFNDAPLRFAGEHFSFADTDVHPKPQRPGGPPLWVGARTVAGLRRAAELELGVLLEAGCDATPYYQACAARGRQGQSAHTGEAAQLSRSAKPGGGGGGDCDAWVVINPTAADPLAAAVPLLDARSG